MLEVGADRSRAKMDTKEVHNYTRAMEHGLQRLKNLPISKRLLCELHSVLMDGVSPSRGAFIVPGELKRDQNWIGGRIIQNARYVPPPPSVSEAAFDKLDLFIHRDFETLPLLVKLALIHYQFEAIHPYPDGNGRVGRLLIPLMLCERQALSQCPSSKQMGLLSVFHKGGSGSSLFDVKPLGVDGSSGGFGWSVF